MNRGGGWYGQAAYCRAAERGSPAPGFRGNYLGLRVSLVPVAK